MVYSSLLIKFFFHANLSISILSILSIYLFSVKLCINATDLENYIPQKGAQACPTSFYMCLNLKHIIIVPV